MPKLTIDGIEVEVEPGTSILQAAEEIGVEIPRFCYHDKLSVPANCRMCLVEIEGGPPKPAASCAMACGDGMAVKTDSDMVKKARKGVMEMLLINHPLDCPICDQGGECDLQDQAVGYGFDRSRFSENKRAVPDKELGPLISTTMTRCINCTRCVRFAEEIAGTPVLGQLNRGEDAEIGTFIDELVQTELSGNLVDVCPVGALTSKPYQFKARPWELRKTESIDVHDAVGSNIRVDVKGREVLRILPRLHEDVNEEWINDRTRYAYDGLSKARLDRPYMRNQKSSEMEETTWAEAFERIAERLEGLKPKEIAALSGDLVDVESVVAMKDLMGRLGSENMDCRTDGADYDVSNRANYIFNSTIAGIEDADAILIIGSNPRWEASLVNARIRKTWMEKDMPVALIGEAADLTYPYEHLGEGIRDLDKFISAKTGFAKTFKNAERPLVIVGAGAFQRKDASAVQALLADLVKTFKISKTGWNGYNVLQHAAGRVGALDVGFVPGAKAKGFSKILEGSMDGSVKALFLLGADEFDAPNEVGGQCFTVYIGHHGDHGAQRADVILPGAAYTEKDGIYVNTEGRPQLAKKAGSAPGEAREDWTILRALSERLGEKLPYDTAPQLRQRIASEWPHLVNFDKIEAAKPAKSMGKAGSVKKDKFVSPVRNFYMTNAICRASDTMRACSQEFLNSGKGELPKAAE
ncbi:MAG: NADH-quinone oxidoreductase subunit NuoG [Pseudomonadota bacterium]